MSDAGDGDRLSLMIARLSTQKACIDAAVEHIDGLPGFVLEVGLGKGRTFDRLRHCLPRRHIYVFDRLIHCPDPLRPGDDRLFLGDFLETLPRAWSRLGRGAALVHADVGSDDPARDRRLARSLAPLLSRFLVAGGILLSDREMVSPALRPMQLPAVSGPLVWPYFMTLHAGPEPD